MLKCDHCGTIMEEKDALRHKTEDGREEIICKPCFQEITGVDYDTFAFRRENANSSRAPRAKYWPRKNSTRPTTPCAAGCCSNGRRP